MQLNSAHGAFFKSIPIPQLLFAGAWLFFCALLMSSLQIFVDHISFFHQFHAEKYKKIDAYPNALPDLGFSICPAIASEHLADHIMSAIVGISLASSMFHSERWRIIRRFCVLEGSLFLLRSVTITITLLPNPFKACQFEATIEESLVYQGLRVMAGQRSTCGDVLFSGHAMIMVLCCLFWFHYMPTTIPLRISRVMKWIIAIATFCGVASCVCTKFHYSVDVTVGAILATLLFTLYHLFVRIPEFKERKTLFWRFIRWYEVDLHLTFENDPRYMRQLDKADLIGASSVFPYEIDSPDIVGTPERASEIAEIQLEGV